MVNDFEKSGHPVFKGISPLGRGILKRKNNRDTIHFNGEYSNIDLLYRTVHSENQLCIHGAVTNRCEKQSETDSGKKSHSGSESARRTPRDIHMKREELKSVVDIPKPPPASGKRMLQNLESFESMTLWSKIESLRTTAGFFHPVEKGSIYFTTLHKEDGWRKCTSLCKEYRKQRNDEDSRPDASIDAHQQIGPILDIEHRHGWHGSLCCTVQPAHPFVRMHSSHCLKHV